jgi:hypothetical protein
VRRFTDSFAKGMCFLVKENLNLLIYQSETVARIESTTIPTYLIDKHGNVVVAKIADWNSDSFRKNLDELLK